MSSSLFRVWTMSLIHVDPGNSQNHFQMKMGEATSYFEQRRLWEEDLRRFVLDACKAVYKARANDGQHLGDLLYCALAHSINEIIATVVRQKYAFRPDKEIDIRFAMRETSAWKPDAQLRFVVAAAAWILRPYKDVDPAERQLVQKVLEDFEIIWLEVISPMFDNQTGVLGLFTGGGNLDRKLLGPDLHPKLRDIRIILKEARGQDAGRSGKNLSTEDRGGSAEASAPTGV